MASCSHSRSLKTVAAAAVARPGLHFSRSTLPRHGLHTRATGPATFPTGGQGMSSGQRRIPTIHPQTTRSTFRPPHQPLAAIVASSSSPSAHNTRSTYNFSTSALASIDAAVAATSIPTEDKTPSTSSSRPLAGPMVDYEELIASGSLKEDEFQRTIIETLQELHDRLVTYTPIPIEDSDANENHEPVISNLLAHDETSLGMFTKLAKGMFSFSRNKKEEEKQAAAIAAAEELKAKVPKGLYLYGSVGTGKTMLMDLFFNSLEHSDKKRIHFHNFMLQLHARLHKLKMTSHRHKDAIPFLAKQLAQESRVLCLDEFQVTDIADAMLLRRLLEELVVKRGVVLVTTSNRIPSELYKNGIQRESFLPGIAVLEEHCVVKCLDGGIDYRREKKTFFAAAKPADKSQRGSSITGAGAAAAAASSSSSSGTIPLKEEQRFFWPLGPDADRDVDKYFDKVRNGFQVSEKRVGFLGRELVLPKTAGGIAKCSFDELCNHTLSAADYLHLAETFHTLILTDIPKLLPTTLHRNETRRLITLIDALYECKVKLICSADGPISEIFGGGTGNLSEQQDPSLAELTPAQRQLMDDLGLKSVADVRKSPIFSGEEEKFAVQRAESRLVEMQGPGWGL